MAYSNYKLDMASSVFCSALFLCLPLMSMAAAASLKVDFYKETCPSAEAIVRRTVYKAMTLDPGLGAGIIRMHFHDCFVRGCDASILLDSTPGSPAEKEHPANNPSLRGYEVIDEAKAEIEATCPGTVSCADIITLAARDSTFIFGGINYAVPAGRQDGPISNKDEPTQNLPAPSFNLTQLQDSFAKKGLSLEDIVTLSGSHSVGVSHCSSFSKRLYSFNTTTPQDPSIDPAFATDLRNQCPSPSNEPNSTLPLDGLTPYRLDNKYYNNLWKNKGLLTSDQTLTSSPSTARTVSHFGRHGGVWARKFAKAMVRMGSIDVLTGNQGEIRRNCRVINY